MSGSGTIAGIILAAGASSRMGSPKALLALDGETFLDRLIAAFEPHCAPVLVVLGFHAGRTRAGICRSGDVTFVTNPDPDRGMLSSLQCGLAEVPATARASFGMYNTKAEVDVFIDALLKARDMF